MLFANFPQLLRLSYSDREVGSGPAGRIGRSTFDHETIPHLFEKPNHEARVHFISTDIVVR